jgi:signal transduction histidine kinase
VDADGQIIYHPDRAQVGQDLREHEGVRAVIRGQAGATYHQEPDGQELVVGYAPVAGPGWGLIVQEPWKALIAPMMRLSLLAPLAVVAAALVSGLALTFGLRYVVRPLQTLDKQATRVAWGDFAAAGETVGGVQEIEDLRRTLEGMADQIQRYQSGMRDYIAAVTMAQEEERKRLARELHDETVQSLIALGHRVEMVQKALGKDPERARQRLAELQSLAGEIQAEVRRYSQALRPLYLEDLGFVPALEMLAQETGRGNGLAVSLQVEGEVRRLAPDLELTAYRIVQEGLSNVVRHAGAKTARLTVVFASDGLTLRVMDDGCGFEPPVNPAHLAHTGHFGLMGIHERALLLGGQMEVRSSPGHSTTLEVMLPLKGTSRTTVTPPPAG